MNNGRREASKESIEEIRRNNKSILIVVICGVLAMAIAYTITMIGNPMRRPNPMPTNYVLNLTPLGTHIDDVISVVENYRDDWRIEMINREQSGLGKG